MKKMKNNPVGRDYITVRRSKPRSRPPDPDHTSQKTEKRLKVFNLG
jgi:hypothetical protein